MIDSLLQAADEGNFNELVDLLKGNQQIINVNSHNKVGYRLIVTAEHITHSLNVVTLYSNIRDEVFCDS